MYGLTNIAVVPMRAEANNQSEMVSQLLWGETFSIEQREQGWLYVCSDADHYYGWIDERMAQHFVSEDEWMRITQQPYQLCNCVSYATHLTSGERVLLPHGAMLYKYNQETQNFVLNNEVYRLELALKALPAKITDGILHCANDLLNTPYLWGGRTALGIDCSGLVQMVFRLNKIALPRDANRQVKHGTTVDFNTFAKACDLAFFGNDADSITHVGLVLSEDKIMHASGGSVHTDRWDTNGIYSEAQKKYTHSLRVIKRIVD
ncbi:hydrolase Nlp/P60 [Bacteroidia bacterium]|nr:hydrolase Nlp/P60 [Bacteroidia bacterium]